MNIKELVTRFATKDELVELQKAMQNAVQEDYPNEGDHPSAQAMIEVDYDAELQRLVNKQSPFLSYLESRGCVSPTNSVEVGYRKKLQVQNSSFIEETADIPAHDPSKHNKETAKMTTLVYPVEVSDMAQAGINTIDLLNDEIRDGFLDIAQSKDIALLQGTKASTKDGFDGFLNTITTHTDDMGGSKITKDAIDILAQEIIDDGGSPDAILTTAKVGRQLNDILYPGRRIIDQVDLTLGTRVTGYHAPNGQTIPIVVDPNIDTTSGDVLAFVNDNSLRVKELRPPSMVPLAKTKLSTSRVLFTFFTFYNRSEYRNGMITGIGDD